MLWEASIGQGPGAEYCVTQGSGCSYPAQIGWLPLMFFRRKFSLDGDGEKEGRKQKKSKEGGSEVGREGVRGGGGRCWDEVDDGPLSWADSTQGASLSSLISQPPGIRRMCRGAAWVLLWVPLVPLEGRGREASRTPSHCGLRTPGTENKKFWEVATSVWVEDGGARSFLSACACSYCS